MLRNDAETIARQRGWLSRQPCAFQDQILEVAELKHYQAGTSVYMLGDPPDYIWGLVGGEVSVLLAPESGSPILAHIAKPVFWAGESAVINEGPRHAQLIARRDSWTLRVNNDAIERMTAKDPKVWKRIGQITVGHLFHAFSVITGLLQRDPNARVSLTLRRLADLNHDGAGSVILNLSQDELGEMANLTRPVIARTLAALEKLGLIRHGYREIEIVDIAVFTRYVDDLMGRQ